MDFSSLVNETQEPLDLNKISLTHEVASRDSQASERERNLQTDSDQPEEEVMPVLSGIESHDDIFSQPSYTSEPLEDHTPCTTNLSSEQADPVEMSSLEARSPEVDEVFETIDTTLYRDNYIGDERNLSAEDAGNEVHPWSDDGQTQQTLDDRSTSEAFEEHGASKSSRELRERISVGSSSGKLDGGISENWDVENSDNSQMDEDHNDDEYKEEEMPKQRKKPKHSEKQTTDAQKQAKRRRKAKEPDSTRTEPPKRRFPHGTRRKRRQVDKDLLEKPEYELDHRQIVIRQLILLGEAKSKEGAALRNNQSNTGFFSNASHFDQDNPYDDDNDPSGEKAHREFLRNTKKVNYQTHMNREKSGRWSKAETELFYEAICQFGADFGMTEKLFPNRTHRQVKSKFKTEERIHPSELCDAMSHRSTDYSHFEKVIQLLQTQAEEESRQDDVNGDPTTVSQDAANGNEEERDQLEKADQDANGFDGEPDDFEKINEWDGDHPSEYNEYEAVEWDASASSRQNEEKYSEDDEFY